jgi:AraC family transcriptional regulator of arabinose operon
MGTITSAAAAAAAAGQAIPTSSGEITVADILCEYSVHGPGSAERYWHHQWAVILITRGGYRVGVDPQRVFDAEAGDLVIMRPETDHAWTTVGHPRGAREGVAAAFVLLRPTPRIELLLLRHREIRPHYALQRIGTGPTWRRIVRCFRQMQRLEASSNSMRAQLQINLLEQALLWAAASEREAADPVDPRVRRAIEYMGGHLADTITIEELCQAAGTSRSQLATLFPAAVGYTPMRYLEKLRLERAMQLLRMTSRTVDSIATDVGFCDAKHFARRFRTLTGLSPTVYREGS